MKKIQLILILPLMLIGTNHHINVTQKTTTSITNDNHIKDFTINKHCTETEAIYFGPDGRNINKDIDINNHFKRMYLGNDSSISLNSLIKECSQITKFNNDDRGYGYVNYLTNDEFSIDINGRIQNWVPYYLQNSTIDVNDNIKWGLDIINYKVNSFDIWKNHTKANKIDCRVAYSENDSKRIFESGSACTYTIYNGGIENKLGDIKAMPFVFYKDGKAPMWPHFGICEAFYLNDKNINYDYDSEPYIGRYNIDNLISINGGSYKNKTIKIGLNNALLTNANKLQQYHQDVFDTLITKWTATENINEKISDQTLWGFINTNFLDIDNFDAFINFYKTKSFNTIDAYKWLKENYSQKTLGFLDSIKFSINENPQIIIDDIKNDLNFNIHYSVRNPSSPDIWIGKVASASFNDLTKGMDLPLFINSHNEYDFKIDYISCDEVNKDDIYIQEQSTSKVYCECDNLICSDNVYTLSHEYITSAEFSNDDEVFNQKYYCGEIDEQTLFDKYVKFYTNYGELGNWTLLTNDKYVIKRRELEGIIEISINVNGRLQHATFTNFKCVSNQIPDIDGSLDAYNLTCIDLDNNEIRKLLALNKFDKHISENINCDVMQTDNIKGMATVKVDSVNNDNDLTTAFHDVTFNIKNLKPYFISQVENINEKILKKKPNEITISDCWTYLFTMSEEFKNRHSDNLSFKLEPKDEHSLIVTITYLEKEEMKTLSYTFNNFGTNKTNMEFILMICTAILAIILFIIGFIYFRNKLRNRTK